MSDKPNYVGKGWESSNGKFINLSLNLEKLSQLPTNSYGDIQVTVSRRKEQDFKSKATHNVTENTYKKDGSQ